MTAQRTETPSTAERPPAAPAPRRASASGDARDPLPSASSDEIRSPAARRSASSDEIAAHARAAHRAGRTAAAVAAGLAIGKLLAGQLGQSAAVTASAVDSLMDVFASSANAMAIRLAHAGPDRDHPFGHAKIETLAIAAQGLLIGGSGVYLVVEGTRRVIAPQPLRLPGLTLGMMAASTLVTIALVLYMNRVAKQTRSAAVEADASHYRTDILANVAVLVGVAIAYASGLERVDGVLSILVAGYVLIVAGKLLRAGVRELLDTAAPDEKLRAIEATLAVAVEKGKIEGYHGLRTRTAGRTLFVEIHIELPGNMPLSEAHCRADEVRDAIVSAEPDAQVLVHLDIERDDPDPEPDATTSKPRA